MKRFELDGLVVEIDKVAEETSWIDIGRVFVADWNGCKLVHLEHHDTKYTKDAQRYQDGMNAEITLDDVNHESCMCRVRFSGCQYPLANPLFIESSRWRTEILLMPDGLLCSLDWQAAKEMNAERMT